MVPAFAVLWALLGSAGECPSILEAGRRAYEERRFPAAVAEFEKASRACPNRAVALLPLAQAQLMAQQLEDSLQTLDALLQLDSGHVDALKLRGDVLYLLGRETEAEQSLRSVLALDPQHEATQYALARILYQENRFPEATKLFAGLVTRDPRNYRAHDNLALCYAAVREDGKAMQHFLKALELVHKDHPQYDTVYANAAHFLLERGSFEKAFQLAVEAADRNPRSARNFFLAGKALMRLEKPELSIRWFQQAIALDSSYAEAYYWLSNGYRKLGRNEDAVRELKTFSELSKKPKAKR